MENTKLIRFPAKPAEIAKSQADDHDHSIKAQLRNLPNLTERMADVIEGIGDGFALYDQDDRLLLWNQKFANIVHYARSLLRPGAEYEEVLRMCADRHFSNGQISPEEKEAWIDQALTFQRQEGTYERQTQDGRHFLVARRRTQQDCVAVVWSDITAEKEARLAATENEEIYRHLFEQSVLGIALLDSRRVTLANQACLDLFGFTSPEEFQTLKDLDHVLASQERRRIRAMVRQVLNQEEDSVEFEFQGIRRDGRSIWVHASGSRVSWRGKPVVQATFLDISDKKEHQVQIFARNLELVGALAHGIAIEFHKAFSGVMAQMQLANMEAYSVGMDQVSELLDDAERQGGEIFGMIERLLYLYTGGVPVKTQTSVESLVNEALSLSEQSDKVVPIRKARIHFKIEIQGGLPAIHIDRGQMANALSSMITHGVQSMRVGGKLSIRADEFMVNGRTRKVSVPTGKYVRITITDQGAGLDASVVDRFFDPYVASPHKGGGLVMSGAYSIVKHNGGDVVVTSKVGKGTKVQLLLPIRGDRTGRRL